MAYGRSHVRSLTLWIATMDLVCLVGGSAIGVLLRFGHQEMTEYVYQHVDGWFVLFGGVILANYLAGNYRLQYTFSRFNMIVTWAFSLAFALVILSATSYAWFTTLLGRGVLVLSLASYSVFSLFLKLVVYRALFRAELFQCRTVILGGGEHAAEIRRLVEGEYVLPAHRVVASVRLANGAGKDAGAGASTDGTPVVDATVASLPEIVKRLDAGLIVMALPSGPAAEACYPALRRLRFEGVEVLSPLHVAEIYSGRTPLEWIDQNTLLQASLESSFPLYHRLKTVLDVAGALAALVVLAPVGISVAVALKLSAPASPVFYMQTRVGRTGRRFRIFKFRTMVPDAESRTGAVWAAEDDPRVTRLGRVLRRYRLDELPQVLNVIRGDMSLVGPRPERPEITAQLAQQIPFYEERENITPGLTGWAQIRHPYGSTVEDAARKLEYDLYYMKHLSFSLDLQIILMTLRIVLLGKERAH